MSWDYLLSLRIDKCGCKTYIESAGMFRAVHFVLFVGGLALLLQTAGAWLLQSNRIISLQNKSMARNMGIKIDPSGPAGLGVEDSSELMVESSAEIKRKAEEKLRKEREEAERKAAEILRMQQLEQERIASEARSKEDLRRREAAAAAASASAEIASKAVALANPAAATDTSMTPTKNSAFDIGLLIAFPVIVGTLLLFFAFPLISPMLAQYLPPPMSY